MLRVTAGGAGAFMLTASGPTVSRGVGASQSGVLFIEAFPTSPLILSPFDEALPIPRALAPVPKATVDTWKAARARQPGFRQGCEGAHPSAVAGDGAGG